MSCESRQLLFYEEELLSTATRGSLKDPGKWRDYRSRVYPYLSLEAKVLSTGFMVTIKIKKSIYNVNC